MLRYSLDRRRKAVQRFLRLGFGGRMSISARASGEAHRTGAARLRAVGGDGRHARQSLWRALASMCGSVRRGRCRHDRQNGGTARCGRRRVHGHHSGSGVARVLLHARRERARALRGASSRHMNVPRAGPWRRARIDARLLDRASPLSGETRSVSARGSRRIACLPRTAFQKMTQRSCRNGDFHASVPGFTIPLVINMTL